MLRNWHNSSLKKIVPSENKGAKVLCKSVEGKKGLYHKRESFGRSGLFPGAICSGPVAIPFLFDQPWSVWTPNVILQTSGCVEPCLTVGHTSRFSPPVNAMETQACPSSWRLIVCSQEPRGVGATQTWRGAHSSVSTAKQNWTPCLNNFLSKQPHNSFPEHCFIFWNNEG